MQRSLSVQCQPVSCNRKLNSIMTKNILLMLMCGLLVLGICCKKAVAPQSNLLFPKVKAIVQTNCVSCHYPNGPGRPVDLTVDANIAQLSASIKAATVDPVSPQNRRMPQGGELSQADKDVIVAWFNKGGKITD
jgi:uncharacterized membrane protein